jgi:hypothetical protein
MRVALLNPRWTFAGSMYFGCREPHLPIELGLAAALLARAGHTVLVLDAHLFDLSDADLRAELRAFRADLAVITTAPTYLFWRCPPAELTVPMALARAIRDLVPRIVAVGPHGSTTPVSVLRKLPVDGVVMGECEETLARIAAGEWDDLPGLALRVGGTVRVNGGPQAARFVDQAPLRWPDEWVRRHAHHHHRFEATPMGPGAEVEASRGCPYSCTFCAKENFRDRYRRRPVASVIEEIAALRDQGVEYVYLIDEIFLPNAALLEALAPLRLKLGVQTRIDLWRPEQLELLGRAGCVSIEAGVESLTESGRADLAKRCRLNTDALAERLMVARRHVPFVQANLLEVEADDPALVERWRERLLAAGVWSNDPVPLFAYPGTPEYRRRWGEPDDRAWERAVEHYRSTFHEFSDIQDAAPAPLAELERLA